MCHLRRGELEVLPPLPFRLMEGMPSDDENDRLSSDEEGEHNAENFSSFAHPASSPLLQGFLHKEELCQVALTSVDVIFHCED